VCIVVVEGVGVEPSALTWLSALSAAVGGRAASANRGERLSHFYFYF